MATRVTERRRSTRARAAHRSQTRSPDGLWAVALVTTCFWRSRCDARNRHDWQSPARRQGGRASITVPTSADCPTRLRRQIAESRSALRDALREEIADLTRTRDELLPLLMSGKVRVADDLAVA